MLPFGHETKRFQRPGHLGRQLSREPLGGTGDRLNAEAFLTTSAEVGIAIAGFSGIAAVLGRRGEGDWSPQDTNRIRVLLRASFSAVVFSLLPIGLFSAALPERSVWAVASGLYFAFIAFFVAKSFFKERGTLTASTEMIERWYLVFFIATPFIHMALHLLNLIAFRTAWPYLFGLLLTLILAFTQFVRLIRSLWMKPQGAA